jgi:protein-tyrosine-phosphatase
MIAAAKMRDVHLTSRSRPLKPADLQNFDFIIGMDYENIAAIQVAADYWASKHPGVPKDYRRKVGGDLLAW